MVELWAPQVGALEMDLGQDGILKATHSPILDFRITKISEERRRPPCLLLRIDSPKDHPPPDTDPGKVPLLRKGGLGKIRPLRKSSRRKIYAFVKFPGLENLIGVKGSGEKDPLEIIGFLVCLVPPGLQGYLKVVRIFFLVLGMKDTKPVGVPGPGGILVFNPRIFLWIWQVGVVSGITAPISPRPGPGRLRR